jgi:hypothetical protein
MTNAQFEQFPKLLFMLFLKATDMQQLSIKTSGKK